MYIGDAIYDARKKMGLSREALGNRLRMSESAIAGWENSKNRVAEHKIPAIAATLELSEADLRQMNGICSSVGSNRKVRSQEALAAVPTPSIHKLCGDCNKWKSTKRRNGVYRLGCCEVLEITTERCDWCKKGKEDARNGE